MKEDYLWDKTGEDDEIRRLEETLSVFRHQPSLAPKISFKLQPSAAATVSMWRTFNLRLALAFSALVVIAAGSWAAFQNGMIEQPVVENVFVSLPAVETPAAAEPGSENISPMQPTQVRRLGDSSKAITPVKTAKRKQVRNSHQPILTAEEKYAYNEVRRALSISGEKFRIVKETIIGIDPAGPLNGR